MFKQQSHLLVFSLVIGLVLCLVSWGAYERLSNMLKQKTGESLETVLHTTHQAIVSWADRETASARVWANDPDIQKATVQLLNSDKTPSSLINNSYQENIRRLLLPLMAQKDYQGYFIIDRNNISLASSRDSNIGTDNLLKEQEAFLNAVWAGQNAMSLPLISDVPLPGEQGELRAGQLTMFAGAPVFNSAKEVIAVFVFRINPAHDFSPILQQGRIGLSGETYAFNQKGEMISVSRFMEQLHDINYFLEHEKQGYHKIELKNPGFDLTSEAGKRKQAWELPLTLMAQQAIQGKSGVDLEGYRDYRGVPVLGAWLWDRELQLGIATEIDADEAFASIRYSRNILLFLTMVALAFLAAIVIGFTVNRRLVLKSAREMETIIEKSPVAMVLTDQIGNVELFNRSFIQQFGWTTKDVRTPEQWWNAAYPDENYRQKVQKGWEVALAEAQKTNTEIAPQHWKLTCKNGDVKDVEFRMFPVSETVGVIALHDLTKINQAMDTIRYERDRAQKYLDTVDVMILALDELGNITQINQRGCDILGYQEDELLGKNWFTTCVPEDTRKDLYHGVFSNMLRGGTEDLTNKENEVLTQDGERRLIAWKNNVLTNDSGQINGVLCAGADITEARKIELETQRLQLQLIKMQKTEAIGQLSAGVAHNFNNMLGSIIGFAGLAKQKTDELHDEALDRYFTHILNNSYRARDLVEQIQSFSQTLHLDKQPAHLEELIVQKMDFIFSVLPSSVSINTHFEPATPQVLIDKTQLQHILASLLINASDAMDNKGSIDIRVYPETVSAQICGSCHEDFSGDYVVLEVDDTGPGIEEDLKQHIFNPFFTTKDVGKGTGMGLSMVHGVIHDHGGHIRLASEAGQGTRFYLYFPATKVE